MQSRPGLPCAGGRWSLNLIIARNYRLRLLLSVGLDWRTVHSIDRTGVLRAGAAGDGHLA